MQFVFGLNSLSGLLLSAVLLNSALFVESAILLYRLSFAVLKHELYAFHSAIFFCLSPATIFFIAPYSESLFAFCTFKVGYFWRRPIYIYATFLVDPTGNKKSYKLYK